MGSLFGQAKGPPGGLSINTGAANSAPASQAPSSGSLFPPKSGGLFGGSGSTGASAGTLFGASTTNATTTQSGSLFGNTTTTASPAGTLFGGAAASAPSAAGSLFGGPAAQQNTASTGASLFGGATATTSSSNPFASLAASKPISTQPPQATGLFAGLNLPQPQQQSTNLFGSTLGGASQPQQTSSLFGSTLQQPQQQQQQPQNSNPFGFGQTQTQQQNPSTSLFGTSTSAPVRNQFQATNNSTLGAGQQPQRSIFSASIGQYTQAAQTVPGVRISLENLRPTTRYEDLHEDLQKSIAALDAEILQQISLSDECAQFLPSVARIGESIPADVTFLESKLDATRTALITDATAIDAAKQQVRADASDAQRSFHTIAALRMPSHLMSRSIGSDLPGSRGAAAGGKSADPGAPGNSIEAGKQGGLVPYFAAQADAMTSRLAHIQRHLREVETYLSGLEAQTATQVQNLRMGRGRAAAGEGLSRAQGPDERIRELAAVLREFESGILTVASSVGQARESLQEAQLADGGNGLRWRR